MERYLWNPESGIYHDYDFELGERSPYEAVNGMAYPLWCGLLNHEGDRVETVVASGLERFEVSVRVA